MTKRTHHWQLAIVSYQQHINYHHLYRCLQIDTDSYGSVCLFVPFIHTG